jgi:peptidoglycan/xylan/chitin deacetylase (PgdA/CDA1 family)
MFVSPESFAEQMAYLVENGFRVIPLADLLAFLDRAKPLPLRSVVITIDDGYRSAYEVAYPVLKAYGFPATIFVYTDFVGARSGLRWDEMREMVASGLIDIQPHSKSHSNMSFQGVAEGDAGYRARIAQEIAVSSREIDDKLGLPLRAFAYPYGDTNEYVIARLRAADYRLGVTVYAGGNPAFAYPYMLRRTMIFGQDDLARFTKKLEVFRDAD